jgi:hypothetical protein
MLDHNNIIRRSFFQAVSEEKEIEAAPLVIHFNGALDVTLTMSPLNVGVTDNTKIVLPVSVSESVLIEAAPLDLAVSKPLDVTLTMDPLQVGVDDQVMYELRIDVSETVPIEAVPLDLTVQQPLDTTLMMSPLQVGVTDNTTITLTREVVDGVLIEAVPLSISVQGPIDTTLTMQPLQVGVTDDTAFTVETQPPNADLFMTGNNDCTADFDASGSTDPDSNDFNLEYRFDPGDGSGFTQYQSSPTYTHTYSTGGTKNGTVEVRDPDGNVDQATGSAEVACLGIG